MTLLDPNKLALTTPYSREAWERALDVARADEIPESTIVSLVNGGAWPSLIATLPKLREVTALMIEKITQLSDIVKPYLPPDEPTDVRERALWLRRHRNTGPKRKPEWSP